MRLAPIVSIALLMAGPVVAQDAAPPAEAASPAEPAPASPAEPEVVLRPDVAKIAANADRDFWCAIAYSLTTRAGQIGGNEELAMAEATKSQILFAGLVTSMKAGGYQESQFNALTAEYTIKLMDPFAQPQYTRAECEAAVPEAQAIVEAAQPAAPAAPEAEMPQATQ